MCIRDREGSEEKCPVLETHSKSLVAEEGLR